MTDTGETKSKWVLDSDPWKSQTGNFSHLTDSEQELLHKLMEEMGESIQAICKVLQRGLYAGWDGKTNEQSLNEEIGDVLTVIGILENTRILDTIKLEERMRYKNVKIHEYLKHELDDYPENNGG